MGRECHIQSRLTALSGEGTSFGTVYATACYRGDAAPHDRRRARLAGRPLRVVLVTGGYGKRVAVLVLPTVQIITFVYSENNC